jgi:SNF2 family DNA or RNA helicase
LQTAATCDIILKQLNRQAPILIIAPLSTLAHWYREFTRWTDLNAIVYHGLADDRKEIRKNEFVYECDRPKTEGGVNSLFLKRCIPKRPTKFDNPWMVDVVITTPEMMITDDTSELAAIEWSALIVDEAHRMKNHNSKLGVTLRNEKFVFLHKILLTG